VEWLAHAHPPTSSDVSKLIPRIETRREAGSGDSAAATADPEIVAEIKRHLKRKGASIDDRDTRGQSFLHAACSAGNIKLAEWLISHKADIDARDHDHWTPLFSALATGHVAAARYMLGQGANRLHRAANGSNAILVMCNTSLFKAEEFTMTLDELLKAGVGINDPKIDGATPLITAVSRGDVPRRVEILLAHGADPHIHNAAGDTALHIAIMTRSVETVRILAKHGANRTVAGSQGKTMMELAEETGDRRIVDAIVSIPINICEMSDYELSYIFAFVPPTSLSALRIACRRFDQLGAVIFAHPDYWRMHGMNRVEYIDNRQAVDKFGKGMDEWMAPVAGGESVRDYLFKIVVVGGRGVGKTSFLDAVLGNPFREDHHTIGSDFVMIRRSILGKIVTLQIVETPSDRRIGGSSLYRCMHGIIAMYDITDRRSFVSLEYDLDALQQSMRDTTVAILVGAKADLEDQRVVTQKHISGAFRKAQDMDINMHHHITISNRTGTGCQLALKILTELLVRGIQQREAERAMPAKHQKDCSLM
jgi:ankyrin repeat protein/GTPase SAR1 family protein